MSCFSIAYWLLTFCFEVSHLRKKMLNCLKSIRSLAQGAKNSKNFMVPHQSEILPMLFFTLICHRVASEKSDKVTIPLGVADIKENVASTPPVDKNFNKWNPGFHEVVQTSAERLFLFCFLWKVIWKKYSLSSFFHKSKLKLSNLIKKHNTNLRFRFPL